MFTSTVYSIVNCIANSQHPRCTADNAQLKPQQGQNKRRRKRHETMPKGRWRKENMANKICKRSHDTPLNPD